MGSGRRKKEFFFYCRTFQATAETENTASYQGGAWLGTWIRTKIDGVIIRVRDSGVELSPTGTDRRGGPRTASNRTVRASSAIAGRIDAVAHAADQTATFGQSGGMASVGGHRYIKIFFISVAGRLATRPPGHSRPVMAS